MMTVFHMDSKENVDDRIGPLALAQKEEPIEKKIGRPGGAIDLGDPVIVEINSAALDVLPGLAFGRAKAGLKKEINQGNTLPR